MFTHVWFQLNSVGKNVIQMNLETLSVDDDQGPVVDGVTGNGFHLRSFVPPNTSSAAGSKFEIKLRLLGNNLFDD